MLVKQRRLRQRVAGFTLVELLVTILIVTVGLLGLAKLQATAVSNTSVARTRALMTFQAEALAGMIRANPGFWVTSGATAIYPEFKFNTDASGTVVSSTNMVAPPLGSCTNIAGTCTPANLAYDDMVTTWTPVFKAAFPGASATIACVPATGSTCGANPVQPHGYDITLTWQQKLVAMNNSTVNSTSMATPVSMVFHVQP
jgi:type IV pilus assembly protein PilV